MYQRIDQAEKTQIVAYRLGITGNHWHRYQDPEVYRPGQYVDAWQWQGHTIIQQDFPRMVKLPTGHTLNAKTGEIFLEAHNGEALFTAKD